MCWLEVIDKEEAWKQLLLACEYSFLGASRANVKNNFWFQPHIQRSMGGVLQHFQGHAQLGIMPLSGFIVVSTTRHRREST